MSAFTNVVSDKEGGVFYLDNVVHKLRVCGCTFTDTRAGNGGRQSRSRIKKFSGPKLSGGVMAVVTSVKTMLVVEQCTFTRTRSGSHGGGAIAIAIHYRDINCDIIVQSCNFTDVYTRGNGGALSVQPARNWRRSRRRNIIILTVKQCSISSASSGLDGGGFYLENLKNVIITRCTFQNCLVKNNGGALYVKAPITENTITIKQCSISSTSSGLDGGGFYLEDLRNVNITHSTFENCSTKSNGGVVYSKKVNIIDVSYARFTRNLAGYQRKSGTGFGGGMYIEDSKFLNITECQFHSNEAKVSGGSIASINVKNMYMTRFKILVTIHGKIWSFLSVIIYPSLYMFLHQNLMANSNFNILIQINL